MDTRQVENFLMLYRVRNTHGAAAQLYISQQGLSKSIQSLERELGITLFERTRTGMVPTRAGDYFHERVLAMSRELHQTQENLAVIASGRAEAKVPCSFGVLHVAYGLFRDFEAANPNVRVRWKEFDDAACEQEVLSGAAPLGIAVRHPGLDELVFAPLFSCPMVALVPQASPLSAREALSYRDLRDVPLAFEGDDFNCNRYLRDRCLEEGFFPNVVAETSEIMFSMRLAHEGQAVAVVPDFVARQYDPTDVRVVPFADAGFRWEMGLVWQQGREPDGVYGDLADFLLSHRRQLG